MTETIESVHRKIYTKMKLLLKLEKNLKVDLGISNMIDEYFFNITPFLNCNGSEIDGSDSSKVVEFLDIYNSLGIEERMVELSSKYITSSTENKKLLKEIENISIVFNDKEERELCKNCGGIMQIDCNIFKLVCRECK